MFIETIKVLDGRVYNIEFHNDRCNHTRQVFFENAKPISLQSYIKAPLKGLFRCRILYAKEVLLVEYIPYQAKSFKRFKIVQSNLVYNYKYANRATLEQLTAELDKDSDIIIEKNGLLTDTSIANIAFYDGASWLTPKTPLLEGTIRRKLLKNGFLKEENIKSEDIKHFKNFALMNAMIGFQVQKSTTDIITKEKRCL